MGHRVTALISSRKRQNEERWLAGAHWQDHGLVFSTTIGAPLEPSNLSRSFLAALTRTGTRRVRFHDVRHSAATLLQAQGVPDMVIAEILGHSRISTMMDMSVKVRDAAKRDAAAKMGALFD